MAANNLTNKLKVFAEATTNKLDDTAFAGDSQRQDGYQPNQIISSKITNTILRQTSVVTTALVEALKELSEKNLTNAMTFGSDTVLADAKTAIKEALVNVKVAKAVLADNVVGGALVEETSVARKFKAGWQISQEFKEKMVFKGTWAGTYMNNDIVYYGTNGVHKGYYVVYGLSKESVDESSGVITPAGTLIIKSTDVPTSAGIKNNLQRLTYETKMGTNGLLSRVTEITQYTDDNEIPSGKAVYEFVKQGPTLISSSVGRVSSLTVNKASLVGYKTLLIFFYDKNTYHTSGQTRLLETTITIPYLSEFGQVMADERVQYYSDNGNLNSIGILRVHTLDGNLTVGISVGPFGGTVKQMDIMVYAI